MHTALLLAHHFAVTPGVLARQRTKDIYRSITANHLESQRGDVLDAGKQSASTGAGKITAVGRREGGESTAGVAVGAVTAAVGEITLFESPRNNSSFVHN